MKVSYSTKVKERMAGKFQANQKGGLFHGKPYDHILTDLKYNFIDGNPPEKKCMKGNLTDANIKYHYAEHLNSSQTMCIAYFKKFFECPEYESLLAEILMMLKIDVSEDCVFSDAVFEHIPCAKEATNFDFYLTTSDGRQITWEIKFTEAEFGSVSLETDGKKYLDKYKNIYMPMLSEGLYCTSPDEESGLCPCLETGVLTDLCSRQDSCAIKEFYRYYQIRRNILYAKKNGDYVLFLTPRENDNLDEGRAYIEYYAKQHNTDRIRNIYWEDLLDATLQVVSCEPGLLDYYTKFKDKYFSE